LLFCWSEAAPAEADPPVTAEGVLAAYDSRIHEAMGPVDGARRCPRGEAGDETIVVCGRSDDSRMRLPLGSQPVEGARRRLVAGEAPSGRDGLTPDRCLRLCYQPVTIPIIPAIRALGSGLDRILHPD
jgi:hypothetical protein